MKIIVLLLSFIWITDCYGQHVSTQNSMILYDFPQGIKPCRLYEVELNGLKTKVYETKVKVARAENFSVMGMVYFDLSSPVIVTLTLPFELKPENFVIRPESAKIIPKFSKNRVEFTIEKPMKIVIEPDKDRYAPLAIFANAIENVRVDSADTNVVYFGPGVHDAGRINLEDGKTIYIAGGAYVYGYIIGRDIKSGQIKGRGILSSEKYERIANTTERKEYPNNFLKDHLLFLQNCSNININGIIFLDSPSWSLVTSQCKSIKYNDIKLITCRPNSDGMDISSCTDIDITNCFLRTWDDCIAIKAFNNYPSNNIAMTNCVLWNDIGQALEIGYELETNEVKNISFENIDIIKENHNCPISIHNCSRALVSNVSYKNIRIEDLDVMNAKPDISQELRIIDLYIGPSSWTKDGGTGKISGVRFENISVTTIGNKIPTSKISGYDKTHDVSDVVFKNFTINGAQITNFQDGNFEIGLDGDKNVKPEDKVKRVKFEMSSKQNKYE